jgi:hypothetical protein
LATSTIDRQKLRQLCAHKIINCSFFALNKTGTNG